MRVMFLIILGAKIDKNFRYSQKIFVHEIYFPFFNC
jgi:hypothetical protein